MTTRDLRYVALDFHRRMPEEIYRYLEGRGIPNALVHRYRLGWNGERITIPITNRDRQVVFFKLVKRHDDDTAAAEVVSTSAVQVELYGWERVLHKREQIVICEDELDRLVLEAQGLEAVCSTGGAATFLAEWAGHFREIPRVFICFRDDSAGRGSANRLAGLIPHGRIVHLPDEAGGERGSVRDFFVRLGKSRQDFDTLLELAVPVSPENVADAAGGGPPVQSPESAATDEIKCHVPIEKLVARYVPLNPRGNQLVGRCPFHEGDDSSLVVYPQTQSFHCLGCQACGDSVSFLMRMDKLTAVEALEVLRNF